MKKLSPKTKKIVLIVLIAVAVILIWSFYKSKTGSTTSESTDTSSSADSGSANLAASGSAASTSGGYSQPGTPLTQVGKANEAAELQQRYAGMSADAIVNDYIKYRFDVDASFLNFLQQKAADSGKTLAQVKIEDAKWLLKGFGVEGF